MTTYLPFFQGEFIQTVKTERGLYGLTMAAIEQVAQQGLACVTHMSLEVCNYSCYMNVHVGKERGLSMIYLSRQRGGLHDHRYTSYM